MLSQRENEDSGLSRVTVFDWSAVGTSRDGGRDPPVVVTLVSEAPPDSDLSAVTQAEAWVISKCRCSSSLHAATHYKSVVWTSPLALTHRFMSL